MWYFSLELAPLRPFLRYGFGVVEHLVQPEAPRYVADPLPHPHSFYLQLLLEGGALLLVAVLTWLGMVAWWLARAAFARGPGWPLERLPGGWLCWCRGYLIPCWRRGRCWGCGGSWFAQQSVGTPRWL